VLGLVAAFLAMGPALRFEDVAAAAGIHFVHQSGASGRRYMVETFGGGVIVFDYDGDGLPDLYFPNGTSLPSGEESGPGNALYRNRGDGTFEEVTTPALARGGGYATGGTAADVDNDGDVDLYVTRFGPDLFLQNNGDGTFSEVTAAAGLGNPRWASSATFFDMDGDGLVDLYVCNYLDFALQNHKTCLGTNRRGEKIPSYCHPDEYGGVPNLLYRNRGDGSFEDVSRRAGILDDRQESKGLGVVAGDYDNDGDSDLYVANDSTRNFLYRNEGGQLTEVGLESGVGYNEEGLPEAGMGTDFGDIDRDGLLDLVVTNFDLEKNTVYRNLGGGFFIDATTAVGLVGASLTELGFGCDFFDADNNGWLDLIVANGHIIDNIADIQPSFSYQQPKQFFHNRGGGRFEDWSNAVGPALQQKRVGRGLATLDFDGDGDLDVAVSNNGGPAELLRNEGGNAGAWIAVTLVGSLSNRDALGSRVEVTVDGLTQIEDVRAGSGYLSQNELRLHFGLGMANSVTELSVRWPSGKIERFQGLSSRRSYLIKEGVGLLVEDPR